MNYKDIEGYELKIYLKKSASDFNPEANIFFKNLPETVKAKDLDELCQKYGKILSC